SGKSFPFTDRARTCRNGISETFCVPLQLLFVPEDLAEKIKQQAFGRRFSGIGETVIDAVAVATIEDHSGVLQIRQMARNVRLRILQNVLDVAHAKLTMQQQVNDPQSIVVA